MTKTATHFFFKKEEQKMSASKNDPLSQSTTKGKGFLNENNLKLILYASAAT